jgi:microcystin-dependent protein
MPGVFQFSQVAAQNATAVPTVSWAEGMAPSQINDSSRAEMAAVACYRDDISGSIVTTGTSTAYIVSSAQQFDKLTNFNGKMIAFTPHATNGAGPVTMTVDGFANLPVRSAPNVELPSGVLIKGTPYAAVFNQADNALYLQAFYGNLGIPLGAMIDYIGGTSPFSNFAIPIGQALSRTTFASLFALIGTTYGAGDGATTFNLPNLSGRVTAMLDSTGTVLPGVSAVGALVGSPTVTLTAAEIPEITSNVQVSGSLSGETTSDVNVGISSDNTGGGNFAFLIPQGQAQVGVTVSGGMNGAAQSNNTGGAAHPNVQPTFGVNKLLRVA